MANQLQQNAATAMELELARLRKGRRVICVRNIDWNCDGREFEEACRQRLTLAGDVKFLWPAPDRRGRKNVGRVFLGFDTRPDCKAALDQLGQGFEFNGLRVTVQRSGKGGNIQNQVATVYAGSTPVPALSPASTPAPSENQPEAQIVAPAERLSADDQLISMINGIAAAPAYLRVRIGGHPHVSEALATLAAVNPEAARRVRNALFSHPAATVSASSSSIVPVLGAGAIEERTTSATSCDDTVQPETAAVQSGNATNQSDKEDALSDFEEYLKL